MRKLVVAAIAAICALILTPASPAGAADLPLVQNGNQGPHVSTVQYLLTDRGFATEVDGIFGPNTEAQVTAFQESKGLGADGIVGSQTWPALVKRLQQGDSGDAVRALQTQLNRHGYALEVSGTFDAATNTAVADFKTTHELRADTIVYRDTWQELIGTSPPGSWSLAIPADAVPRSAYDEPHHDYPALDLPAAEGTPAYAVTAGTATAVSDDSCGIGAILESNGIRYSYCHFSSRAFEGTIEVASGDQLGLTGTTGNSTGPHLHFQIRTLSDDALRCPQTFLGAIYDGAEVPDPATLPTTGCFS